MQPLLPTSNLLGSKLLGSLGKKLYNEPKYALREFIQNSYDAINQLQRLIDEGVVNGLDYSRQIQVIIEPHVVHVLDKGIGMSLEELWNFCSLGLNEKEHRLDAGTHGIGTYAGASIGHKLEVWTRQVGAATGYYAMIDYDIIFDNDSKKGTAEYIQFAEDLIRKAVTVFEDDTPYNDDVHFTHVKVWLDADAKVSLENIGGVSSFLSMYCPVGFSPEMDADLIEAVRSKMNRVKAIEDPIDLTVNNIPVYKPIISNVRTLSRESTSIEVVDIKVDGTVVAQAWYGLNKDLESIKDPLVRGMVLFLDGFMIDSPERQLVSTTYFTRPDIGNYFTGEIHLLDTSVEPNLDRTWIQSAGLQWKKIEANLRDFIKPLDRFVYNRSTAHNTLKKVKELIHEGKALVAVDVADFLGSPEKLSELVQWKAKADKQFTTTKLKKLPPDLRHNCETLANRCAQALNTIKSHISSVPTPTPTAPARNGQSHPVVRTPFSFPHPRAQERVPATNPDTVSSPNQAPGESPQQPSSAGPILSVITVDRANLHKLILEVIDRARVEPSASSTVLADCVLDALDRRG